jgi:hypothetical protein
MSLSQELVFVKRVQKEFREQFGKELPVDFLKLKGLRYNSSPKDRVENKIQMQVLLKELCKQYGTTLIKVKAARFLQNPKYDRERAVVLQFCVAVKDLKWNKTDAMDMISKHRTCYAKYMNYQPKKKI